MRQRGGQSWARSIPLWVCVALLGVPAAVRAQEDPEASTRREYYTAGLTLFTTGRTAACDVLTFTSDGKHLLAGGDDKFIRTWDVDLKKGLQPSRAPVLRWPTFREQHGNIYTMAMTPDEGRAVVAGHGRYIDGFEATVIRRSDGEMLHTMKLTEAKFNAKNPVKKIGTIWSCAISPSGEQVALGTENGSIWIWEPNGDCLRYLGEHSRRDPEGLALTAADDTHFKVRFLAFEGDDQLVSIGGNGQLTRRRVSDGVVLADSYPFAKKIFGSVAMSRDRKRLAAALNLPTKMGVQILSYPDAKPRSLIAETSAESGSSVSAFRIALSANARYLAVSLRRIGAKAAFYQEQPGEVRIYDLQTDPPALVQSLKQTVYAECLAFHPKHDNVLAVAGGANHEVNLWDIREGTPIGVEVRSPGSGLWGVALDEGRNVLAFQEQRDPTPAHPNQRGTGAWRHFDLSRYRFVAGNGKEPVRRPDAWSRGWTVETSIGDRGLASQWYVRDPGGQIHKLPWDPGQDQFPLCYTFLPSAPGQPIRLAVGHYWGISVFDLGAGPVRRSRLLKGHEGYVTSLWVSEDGKKLVSASKDQTIAGWSLQGWPSHKTLGGAFLAREGKLQVDRVDYGGPLWEVGLSPGDEIVRLYVTRKAFYNRIERLPQAPEPMADIGTPKSALAALDNPTPGVTLSFAWRQENGKIVSGLGSRLVERPIWRLFPMRDNEWVLWRCRDYYYNCSTNGDFHIGWQRSYGAGIRNTPNFYRAEQFRDEFHRSGRVADTLTNWGAGGDVQLISAIEPPHVEIIDLNAEVRKNRPIDVHLEINIRPRNSRANQEPKDVLLWLNDYQAHVLPREMLQHDKISGMWRADVTIEANKLRTGPNLVMAQCYNQDGRRGQAKEPVNVVCDRPPRESKLYGLFIGVGDYHRSKIRGKGNALKGLGADQDAVALRKAWESQKGTRFSAVQMKLLCDPEVTPEAVLGELERLQGVVEPDDLLVVHLGGHGVDETFLRGLKGANGEPLLDARKVKDFGEFLFCCGNVDFTDADALRRTTISLYAPNDRYSLYSRLVKLPCHKLILLDACHGAAGFALAGTEADPIRALTRSGVGPVILAACEKHQEALESELLDEAKVQATGLFAIAVRQIVQEKDVFQRFDQGKGVLVSKQVAAGVKERVVEFVGDLRRLGVLRVKDAVQTPTSFIPAFEEHLELIRMEQKK